MKTLTLTRPDDWHLHVRNGAVLKTVIAHTAKQFARAIIMPNLKPPVTTVLQALAYREEILQAIPTGINFTPLMTLYMTASTTIEEIKLAAESSYIHAFKLYPAGATTNSDAGVADIKTIYPQLAAMEKYNLPLLIHGEVVDAQCDIFDREREFVDTHLVAITRDFPALRVVLEHVTTFEAVQFVQSANANVAATITPQHLLFNRNAMLAGGIRPHFYCLPILKREQHRLALVTAATSGSSKFFLGTDSAPHLTKLKENACGCAGCYSAHAALELYAQAFEAAGALDKLEGFASFYGADFYRLPRNSDTITLLKNTWKVPENYGTDGVNITPLLAGEELTWQLQ
ncbi:MAG: dihydroorotase [Methylococcaceae bacterium]|nr:dihydroorotase [Methylococcaceae bacterium]MDZ4155070.1 dihydroorotase [Methylococcales bacterium]MDP2394485.1 dihydroorotase [Methylococcaceae bacterium]MDP3021528.1 dihydroorotase [Methylococcaceae bacterium]MDP3390353.1 dihydroorotase [Methylococcaceae bacterium]